MSGVGPTVFLLPSSSVESKCGAYADEGGIGRRAGGRKRHRSHRRLRSRGHRGRSSSRGAKESLPPTGLRGEREGRELGRRGRRRAGLRASVTGERPLSRGREVGEGGGWTEESKASDIGREGEGLLNVMCGRIKIVRPTPDMRGPLLRHRKPLSKPTRGGLHSLGT
jgi:hypothetical protein